MMGIDNDLPNAHLFRVEGVPSNLAEIAQFLQEGTTPQGYSEKKNKILAIKPNPITLINKSLYKLGLDDILCRCGLEQKIHDIIEEAHSRSVGGHFQVNTTIKRIIQLELC